MNALIDMKFAENVSNLRSHADKRVVARAKNLRKHWKTRCIENNSQNDNSQEKKSDALPTVLEQLGQMGKVLTDDTGAKASAKLSIMAELSSMKITQDELIESSIGKIVSKLRKSR